MLRKFLHPDRASNNPVHRKYSRHIDIRLHYVRELFADALTKSLPAPARMRHLIHYRLFRIGEAISHRKKLIVTRKNNEKKETHSSVFRKKTALG